MFLTNRLKDLRHNPVALKYVNTSGHSPTKSPAKPSRDVETILAEVRQYPLEFIVKVNKERRFSNLVEPSDAPK